MLCQFNPVAGNLILTDGFRLGLRKDLNGIYLLSTALQTQCVDSKDKEIVLEMTLTDVSKFLTLYSTLEMYTDI